MINQDVAPEPNHQSLDIPEDYRGLRIDKVLAQLFPEYSRSKLTQWLKEGALTINGQRCKPDEKAIGGEHVNLCITSSPLRDTIEAEEIALDVVFEDEYVLVVNKPAGLVVHPGAGNPRHTLVNALLHHDANLQHLPRAGIVHRLDKDTTGLLVIGKTLESHTHLVRQMQAREIQRHYLTLVQGHIIAGGTIDTGFGRDGRNRLKMAVSEHSERQAITHYTVNKQYQCVTLLNVELETGRTHQIRVHMAHIKHPVVGDSLYQGRVGIRAGISIELRQKLQTFSRQALHAYALRFQHPHTGETIHCTAPIPQDFQSLLNELDAYCDSLSR